MENPIVRIQQITLKHFKNIEQGTVSFPSCQNQTYYNNNSEIIGVYGQNGSGKTALVEAVMLVQHLLCGRSLPRSTVEYIQKSHSEFTVHILFYYEYDSLKYLLGYDVSVSSGEDGSPVLTWERIGCSALNDLKRERRFTILEYVYQAEDFIRPAVRYQEITGRKKEQEIPFLIAKRLSQIHCTSMFFNKDSFKIIEKGLKNQVSVMLMKALTEFAATGLFVIRKDSFGSISTNMFLPLAFRYESNHVLHKSEMPVELSHPTVMDEPLFRLLENLLNQINLVLSKIVPGLMIETLSYGEQLTDEGRTGVRMELVSVRSGVRIPLRNESDGIKKMLSVLSALIIVYNHENTCLLVDELDSGVFEFMLGEILNVLEVGGRGQMMFTSHNLRALETLSKESIVLSTANPSNRYIRLSHVKKDCNLRDFYYRSIDLGGQKECIYEETNSYELRRAFRMAGKSL